MWDKQLQVMLEAGHLAAEAILKIYHQPFDVEIKEDNSPVTIADKTADELIRKHLHAHFPNYAFLTEESLDDKNRLLNDYVFIIDPLDGTKDFVGHHDEFTVNIALAYKHEIVAGVIYLPVFQEIFYASKNQGAYQIKLNKAPQRIQVNHKTSDLTVFTSRFHLTDYEKRIIQSYGNKISTQKTLGSSIKGCYIALGQGELTFRVSDGTKEWDTAAMDIIVREAGGIFEKLNGERILYNRLDVYNRGGYVIANRRENILKDSFLK